MFRYSQWLPVLSFVLTLSGKSFAAEQAPQEAPAQPVVAESEASAANTAHEEKTRSDAKHTPAPAAPAPSVVAARETRDTHFTALHGDLSFRVSPAGSATPEEPIRWNQLVYRDGQLVFGARESLGTILWETAIDLGNYAMRSLSLAAGRDANEVATLVMKRELIGHRGLQLVGDGRMDIATANPHFTGPLLIEGAELRLNEQGTLKKHPAVQVSAGGSFVIDNRDLQHVVNKRFNGGDLALSSGNFRFLTRDNAAALERIGTLTVGQGASKFEVSGGGPGKLGTTISIGKLSFAAPAAHLNFVASNGSDFSQNTTVKFLQKPELLHGVIPRTTVNGCDWATVDSHNQLRAYSGYETGSDKSWGPSVNAAPAGNLLVSADRSLASLKFEGEGLGGDDEDRNPLGRIVDLNNHTLTVTGAGIIATGDEFRHQLRGGTLTTTRDNYEIHVSGTGGLAIENTIITDGPNGPTGLIKTGDGELVFSSPKPPAPKVNDNSFTGDVYVNQGTLTLFRKRGSVHNIPGLNIYVGAGQGNARISVRGASEQINEKATVTLRGGPKGEAIFRLDRAQPPRGPRQTLQKLVIEGSGVIEFYSSYIGSGGETTDNTKSILYLGELEINGELIVRGWDKYNTHILIDSKEAPTEELISKIKFEGEYLNKIFVEKFYAKEKKKDYWEIKAEFEYIPPTYPPPPETPEPATTGALLATGALAFSMWYRHRRARKIRHEARCSA